VWGSRGSVIETWETAVRKGEQPKVTDPRMTRFFITAEDAIQLACDSLDAMTGGELFVPRMRAYKLAALRTAFSAVYPGVTFENVSIRPGEKIHEALISSYELPYMVAAEKFLCTGGQFAKEYGQVVSRWCSSEKAEEMSIAELRVLIKQRKNGAKK
jgi:FlaA1/EpsC-like NDP-sugar epimerase